MTVIRKGVGQQATQSRHRSALMACTFTRQRTTARLHAAFRPHFSCVPSCPSSRRYFFSFFRKPAPKAAAEPALRLTPDNLFHPFSKSPFPMLRARGQAIQKLAPCPVCTSSHAQGHPHTHAQPRNVQFECPDCGWPTHCSEEHWKEDEEHQKYCLRLREANEDEHDLRSGRRMFEFELPGQSFVPCFVRSIGQRAFIPQDLRDTKKQSPSRTGMFSGTPVVSCRWIQSGHADTPVNSSATQSR